MSSSARDHDILKQVLKSAKHNVNEANVNQIQARTRAIKLLICAYMLVIYG